MTSLAKRAALLLGRCITATREEGAEIVVTMSELDSNLRMFFPEKYTFFAYDPKTTCKAGDIVLIKKLNDPLTRKITHEIVKVVYPIGNVTDPISGKKVVVSQYREHMEETDLMFAPKDGSGFSKYLAKLKENQNK